MTNVAVVTVGAVAAAHRREGKCGMLNCRGEVSDSASGREELNYAVRHVDKDNIGSYDCSELLYLSGRLSTELKHTTTLTNPMSLSLGGYSILRKGL